MDNFTRTMKITRETTERMGACSMCDRGKLDTPSGYVLVYPYTHVYVITGRGIQVNMCGDCLDEASAIKSAVYEL